MQGLLKSLDKRDITEVLKSSKRFGDHLISACLEDLNDRVGDHDGKLEDHDGRLEHVEDEVVDLNKKIGFKASRCIEGLIFSPKNPNQFFVLIWV